MLPKQKQTDAQKVAYFRQGQCCTPLVQHTCKENVQTQCRTQNFLSMSVRVEFTSPQPGDFSIKFLDFKVFKCTWLKMHFPV